MPAQSPIDNDLRRKIFLQLIAGGRGGDRDRGGAVAPMTPSELGDALGEPRQNITYHLNELVGLGLVVREDSAYRPQPVFLDSDLRSELADLLVDLIPQVESRVHLDSSLDSPRLDLIVVNCLKMLVVLTVLEPEACNPPADEGGGGGASSGPAEAGGSVDGE